MFDLSQEDIPLNLLSTSENRKNGWKWKNPQGKYYRGELYSLEEFISNCEASAFIDSDGHGNFAMIEGDVAKPYGWVKPSAILRKKIPQGTTHIIWYNK